MNSLDEIRHRLQEIATTASTAAEALDASACDFLPPELARLAGALDGIAERLDAVCERLAAGVDPQGGTAICHGGGDG
jgi:hypothetical protein